MAAPTPIDQMRPFKLATKSSRRPSDVLTSLIRASYASLEIKLPRSLKICSRNLLCSSNLRATSVKNLSCSRLISSKRCIAIRSRESILCSRYLSCASSISLYFDRRANGLVLYGGSQAPANQSNRFVDLRRQRSAFLSVVRLIVADRHGHRAADFRATIGVDFKVVNLGRHCRRVEVNRYGAF